MADVVELQMPIDGVYQPALSIPVETCRRFSVHPLKWLRYVGFTIYGTEGHISQNTIGKVVEYSDDIGAGIYYYLPDAEDPILLDPDLMEDRTSDSSTASTRRAEFAQRVNDRDGRACLMTGVTGNTQACHIVPHAKGNEYANGLALHRNEVLDPPLDSIDDPRNGVLLDTHLHQPFGNSDIAFLQTPNFAMSVNDVPIVLQPNSQHLGFNPSLAADRLTLQHFGDADHITVFAAPHNSDARIRLGHDDWPPSLLFDVSYGCAALRTWGVPHFVNSTRQHTRDIYYDGGNGVNSSREVMSTHASRIAARDKVRQKTPDFADMILAFWMHNARKGQSQARAAKAEKTQEKVRTWLDSI